MRYFLIFIIIILSFSCKSQETINGGYFLFNELNSNHIVSGPVESIFVMKVNVRLDSLSSGITKYEQKPCCIDMSRMTYLKFDSLGGSVKWRSFVDKNQFNKPIPSTLTGGVFYRTYDLNKKIQKVAYSNIYHKDIISPKVIVRNEMSYKKRDKNNFIDSYNTKNDTTGGDEFYYQFNELGYINQRKKIQYSLSDRLGKTYFHRYDEIVDFTYDDKGRTVLESYTFNERIEEDFNGKSYDDGFNNSSQYYVGTRLDYNQDLKITYKYDDLNRVINAQVIVSGTLYFEESYFYSEDGRLLKRIQQRVDKSFISMRLRQDAMKSIYYYDEFENCYHLEEYDENDKLTGEQWLDYYDFDEYNNWTRCEFFLKRVHSGTPDMVAYRKFTYYKP